jgi:hypothetical protein
VTEEDKIKRTQEALYWARCAEAKCEPFEVHTLGATLKDVTQKLYVGGINTEIMVYDGRLYKLINVGGERNYLYCLGQYDPNLNVEFRPK